MPDKDSVLAPQNKLAKDVDNSLRGGAMRRALRKNPPRTLTPYEWQHWYAEHGVPEEHRKAERWITIKLRKAKKWLLTGR